MSGALLSPSSRRLRAHRIVIPALPSLTPSPPSHPHTSAAAASSNPLADEYRHHATPHPQLLTFLDAAAAQDFRRQSQLRQARTAAADALTRVWRDGKPHMRAHDALVSQLGLDGAVRETLQPTRLSFHEQLRQRPLDRAILEEIYRGLHGRRVERVLKRGVSWEHWITKGDGTAPVYQTAAKTQQTFAFGGHIELLRTATHPQQFPHPTRPSRRDGAHGRTTIRAAADVVCARGTKRRGSRVGGGRAMSELTVPDRRARCIPEVAFIGRTSSGKSSLINALVNAMITPYGHLQGTTDAVRFYSIAGRLMLVDCPGYGHVNRLHTSTLDAECGQRAMRAYLRLAARHHATEEVAERRRTHSDASLHDKETTGVEGNSREGVGAVEHDAVVDGDAERHERYFPLRNVKRVFVCVSSRGMQHSDFAYCDLLERYRVPFAVVLTKTDSAPIRFLARLTDYTRSRLVRYNYCKELMLTSALRLAGIDKMQDLVASFALGEDEMKGATMDFDSIV